MTTDVQRQVDADEHDRDADGLGEPARNTAPSSASRTRVISHLLAVQRSGSSVRVLHQVGARRRRPRG